MTVAVSVRELMHRPPVVARPEMTATELARLLDGAKVGAAAVLDPSDRVVGIVSERDLLRALGTGLDASTPVGALMSSSPVTLTADNPVAVALEIFREHHFRHLPVLDRGTLVGMLSIRHIVRVAHIEDVRAAGSAPTVAPPGLEGVAVAETAIGDVRGEEGFFHYRGYDATELARRCSFEQVWHLLLIGELPDAAQLAAFRARTRAAREVAPAVAALLAPLARIEPYAPLSALRTSLSLVATSLGLRPTLDAGHAEVMDAAVRLTAVAPVVLLRQYRARRGDPPAEADRDLGYAGAYLQLLTGRRPEPEAARALEQYLILTMDHGFNASTFTARVIASTGADVGAAVVGALGALSGPLHGGAPSRALDTLDAIGTPDRAEAVLREQIERGERLMGFGHRVYKTDDPRSTLLREVALRLGGAQAEFASEVEATALRVLHELKPGRRLYTNVEFYAGVVMNTVGVPRDMFTPTFACSRLAGWTAAVCEQAQHNRLIRPSAIYVGPSAPRPLPDGYAYG
ncbi:MAG TPA: citrate synthase [Candidatus Micrarchaeia archaeon]|nr:citrate synthase [Candidatus Micrarchaeia archaeon]